MFRQGEEKSKGEVRLVAVGITIVGLYEGVSRERKPGLVCDRGWCFWVRFDIEILQLC